MPINTCGKLKVVLWYNARQVVVICIVHNSIQYTSAEGMLIIIVEGHLIAT